MEEIKAGSMGSMCEMLNERNVYLTLLNISKSRQFEHGCENVECEVFVLFPRFLKANIGTNVSFSPISRNRFTFYVYKTLWI
jgi:hypothetical protein